MQKITPHLWFDTQAEEAVHLYTSLFKDSRTGTIARYGKEGFEVHGMPEGTVMTVAFELGGQQFIALNGGPQFTFTPAVSFLVGCETREDVDRLWARLSEGGTTLMPLDAYPFSERYGWLEDRYGLSWQVMFMGDRVVTQRIVPTLMFVGDVCGKAEEAINSYVSMFDNAGTGPILRYGKDQEPEQEGTVMHAAFTLEGQQFAAMDSAQTHNFTFNEAISFLVSCETQEDVDYYWERLSAGGEEGPCGWLKDRYGLSWQVVPAVLDRLLHDPDPKKAGSVMKAMLQMSKLDIAALEQASHR